MPDALVIGGAEIYRAALALADRIELTEVHRAFDGDARFRFRPRGLARNRARGSCHAGGLRYSFVTLDA